MSSSVEAGSLRHSWSLAAMTWALSIFGAACPPATPGDAPSAGPATAPADGSESATTAATKASITADSASGPSLSLAEGFEYSVIARDLGRVRHIAVRANGDLYANLREPTADGKSLVALRDSDHDGVPETIEYFSDHGGGTGIAIHGSYLYFSSRTEVFRMRWASNEELVPSGKTETVVTGLPEQRSHAAKSITIDDRSRLYVNIGAPSNACQVKARFPGSPGQRPCPQLEKQGTIWRFAANKAGQTLERNGVRHATGLRNVVALQWNRTAGDLFGVQHGRDQLHALFDKLYTPKQSAELPAEEFLRLSEGFVGGWPYTYYDPDLNARMVAPEYGGDGKKKSPAGKYPEPIHAFPAHYAPNGLLFYEGTQFPERYREGAFIAWRGSWNRGEFGQEGYRVDFLPMNKGVKTGEPETFVDGFAGPKPIPESTNAEFRPMGLATAPDGSLYVSDTEKGWIWRIRYVGA